MTARRRVTFNVVGVDISDDTAVTRIGENLSDLSWQRTDGRTTAVLHSGGDYLTEAVHTVQRIWEVFPNAQVEAAPDLVTVEQIAARTGVPAAQVQLWTTRDRTSTTGFPLPATSTPARWCWAAVQSWLDTHYLISPDELVLSVEECDNVNTALALL